MMSPLISPTQPIARPGQYFFGSSHSPPSMVGTFDLSAISTAASSELETLPTEFLSAYPFPAFVLYLPLPTHGPDPISAPALVNSLADIRFTRNARLDSVQHGAGLFTPRWSNRPFKAMSQGRDLTDMLDLQDMVKLTDWLTGVSDFENIRIKKKGRIAGTTSEPTSKVRSSVRQMSEPVPRLEQIETLHLSSEESFSEGTATVVSGRQDAERHHDLGTQVGEIHDTTDDTQTENLDQLNSTASLRLKFQISTSDPMESGLWFDLVKIPHVTSRRYSTGSYTIIQCFPSTSPISGDLDDGYADHHTRLDPDGIVSERLVPSRAGGSCQQEPEFETSFPFFSKTPGDNDRTPGGFQLRHISKVDNERDSEDEAEDDTPFVQVPYEQTSRSISRVFPAAEPIIIGGADPDQLTLRRKNRASDANSVENLLWTIDWSKTSLGDRSQWDQALRSMLSLIFAMPLQATLWWGPNLVLLYNEHYAGMLQGKHPTLFGTEGAKGYAEIWASLGPVAKEVMRGVPASKEDDPFLFEITPGNLVEYYHSWYWVPVFDTDFQHESGKSDPPKFLGLFNFTRNTTLKVIAERRLRAIREVSDSLQGARNMSEFQSAILSGLGTEEIAKDVPWLMLYHVDRDDSEYPATKTTSITGEESSSSHGGRTGHKMRLRLTLGGSLGVPHNHRSAIPELPVEVSRPTQRLGALDPGKTSSPTLSMISNLSISADGDSTGSSTADKWPFQEVLQGRKAIIVEDTSKLIEGFEIRGWDALPTQAILLPICNDSSSDIPSGILVMGLNLRRPYDQDYAEWHHQIRLGCYSGLLQVKSIQDEQRKAEELKMMDGIKNNWISNVSHELRLPLTLIAGPVDDLIAESQENPRVKNLLSITKRNVQRLRGLVDQLMDFSRLEGGKYAMTARPIPIGSYTRDLANLFRSAVERSKLDFIVDCDDDLGRRCYVDPDMYEKVAMNLVGNALKYCHQGFIRVELKYAEQNVILRIADSGVGIPRSELGRIGERFFRVESQSRSHEGTGIGLSLTKELIRLMGGSLELQSQIAEESETGEHGSIFEVKLPLGFSHLPAFSVEENAPINSRRTRYAQGIVEEAMQWSRGNDTSSDTASDSGGSSRPTITERSGSSLDTNTFLFNKEDVILVVDDSRDLRTYLTSILQPYVGKVLEATDGQAAFKLARLHRPHLIISDVQMPNMDGHQLLQAVKSDADLRWTPVILLTARAGEGERVEGLLTGAEDYLTKPFRSRELVARASLHLNLGKRRALLEEAFATRLEESEKRREVAEFERKRQELLIDVTSHELRNPTSAIIQCSQMIGEDLAILREQLESVSKEDSFRVTERIIKQLTFDEDLCQNINSCAQSQSRIADDVLALARINLDMLQFTYQPTNVKLRAKEVIAPFVLEAKAQGIDLILALDDPSLDPVPNVMTDPFRLGQVLVNLVSNAMRYSGDGPVQRVLINFAMRSEPPIDSTCVPPDIPLPKSISDGDTFYLYISVTDSGPGLAKEDVQLLFKRFSQATRHANKAFGGSGLGLWISKQISTQMGGRIEVDSELGHGCTFRFFVRVTAAGRDLPEPPAKIAAKRTTALVSGRILIVEDNLINQRILQKQLNKRGLTVEVASHGQLAIDRLRQVCSNDGRRFFDTESDRPFDIVLMDIEMPVMDGLTAIKIIRAEEKEGKLSRSYVIALTGNARQQQIDEAIAHGMDDVIIKPYKIEHVMKKIQERLTL